MTGLLPGARIDRLVPDMRDRVTKACIWAIANDINLSVTVPEVKGVSDNSLRFARLGIHPVPPFNQIVEDWKILVGIFGKNYSVTLDKGFFNVEHCPK